MYDNEIRFRDLLGYEKITALLNKGHTLGEIEEKIKSKKQHVIIISIDEDEPIGYNTLSEASYRTGISINRLIRYKNKANIVHPISFNNKGKMCTIRFDGFEDRDNEDKRPKRFGRSITLLISGKDLVTYRTITEASKENGISDGLIRYYRNKAYGNSSKEIEYNGNTYKICLDDNS